MSQDGIKLQDGTFFPFTFLKGKPYLEVKYRIEWFRKVYPKGRIDTQCVKLDDKYAIYRAEVFVPSDHDPAIYIKLSDGEKREDAAHFGDFLEKAQSASIGRALGVAGFGTAAALEFEEAERVVDSPVSHAPVAAVPAASKAKSEPSWI